MVIKDRLITHGMWLAIQYAHSQHIPLELGPDDFWILIMQGFCKHMELKHEELRSKFVNFDGKKELKIVRDHFVKGAQNNWEDVFTDFTKLVKENIGDDNYTNLVPKFSTTTPLAQAISEASLMNAVQHYFSFAVMTGCGISKVRLTGSLEDWKSLYKTTENLAQYNLGWWIPHVLEPLEMIMKTYENSSNPSQELKDFWKYIFKYYGAGGSGMNPRIDGWLLNFFPYIDDRQSKMAKRNIK